MNKKWFKFTYVECPICGKSRKYKELIKNIPKPINYDQRYIYIQHYDYCGE